MADYVQTTSGGLVAGSTSTINKGFKISPTGGLEVRGYSTSIMVPGALSPNGMIFCKGAWVTPIVSHQIADINRVCMQTN